MRNTLSQDIVITVLVTISFFGALVGLKELYHSEKKFTNYKEAYLPLMFGLVLFAIAIIGNSIVEKRWDSSFLFAFLTIKKVGDWFFRFLLPFGYLLIVYGTGAIFIIFSKRKQH